MKIAGKKPWYLEYLLIIVGTGLMGTAITSCFDAAGMVTGGFSGIAILVKAWTKGLYGNGIPLWITNLILNVPLFLLATKIKGFAFVRKALLGDISLTIWLAILPAWKLSEDFLLVALYGGLLQGIGIGFVFLGGGTTGGTDMLAAIIQKYLRHYSIAQIMQFIDGAIGEFEKASFPEKVKSRLTNVHRHIDEMRGLSSKVNGLNVVGHANLSSLIALTQKYLQLEILALKGRLKAGVDLINGIMYFTEFNYKRLSK